MRVRRSRRHLPDQRSAAENVDAVRAEDALRVPHVAPKVPAHALGAHLRQVRDAVQRQVLDVVGIHDLPHRFEDLTFLARMLFERSEERLSPLLLRRWVSKPGDVRAHPSNRHRPVSHRLQGAGC